MFYSVNKSDARMLSPDEDKKYPQRYRRDALCRSLRIYDKMVEDDITGQRPLYRPKEYERIQRRQQKQMKKANWSNRGSYIAPIFVAPTPNGDLARELKEIAEREAEAEVLLKIVETGGRSITLGPAH